jgi:protein-tyrosine sulfotransferase
LEDSKNIPIHFIVSTGRTGSTLLSSMLNAHPEILSISEQPFTLNLIDGYKHKKNWDKKTITRFLQDFELFASDKISTQFSSYTELEKNLSGLQHPNFQRVIRSCFLSFYPSKSKDGIKAFVAKELIFHTQIKKISRTYPNAKFILLTREPRDNVQIKINRAKRRNEAFSIFRFVAAWRMVYSLLYDGLNKHANERFIIVRYEDIVSDPEKNLRSVCQFLDIDFHTDMLNYDLVNRKNFEEIKDEVPPKIISHLMRDHQGLLEKTNTEKIGIWKREMDPEVAIKVWNECSKVASNFGYSDDSSSEKNQDCFPLTYQIFLFRYYLFNILRPKLYFLTPFWMRRAYRKFKKK